MTQCVSAAQLADLLAQAALARQRAYCPYSGYAVGAAVLDVRGRVSVGCNVENASYGLTVCAERNAIAAAVQAGLQRDELLAVAIVAGPLAEDSTLPARATLPCGACRQVLAEFAAKEAVVTCATATTDPQLGPDLGSPRSFSLAELLPHPFGAS